MGTMVLPSTTTRSATKILVQWLPRLESTQTEGCDDPCEDIDCGVNGSCDKGKCICSGGFLGTFCDVPPEPEEGACTSNTKKKACVREGGCVWKKKECIVDCSGVTDPSKENCKRAGKCKYRRKKNVCGFKKKKKKKKS